MKTYNDLMLKCFEIAKLAKKNTMPNPLVGAIVYDEEKKEIISTGYHQKYGEAHAEVNAIKNANGNTIGKTIIVNLEPCSHYGKTPPCADLIIKSGFKKAIVALVDPNPKVAGQGIKKLQDAKIEVVVGVLEQEARELNKVFLKNIEKKLPYIMLKTATTLDGKIALENGKSKWITNDIARLEAQKLRSQYQAIMSASGTILADNPKLNVRLENETSPIRIIFDPNNKIPLDYNVFKNDGVRIILINNSKIDLPNYIEQIGFDGDFNNLFKTLFEMKIYSIMIEAGCGFNSELLKANVVDEINHFIAPKVFGSGKSFVDGLNFEEIDNSIQLENVNFKQFGDNILINGKIKK